MGYELKGSRNGGDHDFYRCLSHFRGEGAVSCIYPEKSLRATFLCKGPTRRESPKHQFLPSPQHHIIKHHSPPQQRPVTKTRLPPRPTLPTHKPTSCPPIWMKISTVSSLVIAGGRRNGWMDGWKERSADISSKQWTPVSATPRSRLSSTRSLMRVRSWTCALQKSSKANLDDSAEYKIWKKNAPFLYDLILRFVFTVHRQAPTTTTNLPQLCLGMANINHTMVP